MWTWKEIQTWQTETFERFGIKWHAFINADVRIETAVSVRISNGASIGYGASIGDGASIGYRVSIGDGVSIGYGASIGDGASIGNRAIIGNRASIGDGASIGYRVSIGDGASIGNRASIRKNDKYICLGPLGSRKAMLTVVLRTDGTIMFYAGCFQGTLMKFKTAINKTHKNNQYAQEYHAAITFCKLLWKIK